MSRNALQTTKGEDISLRSSAIMFSNPTADTLISAPNEEMMAALHKAFPEVDACWVRYGAQIHRTYKRFVIFTIAGLPKEGENELINWVSYLRVHQEPKDDNKFVLI